MAIRLSIWIVALACYGAAACAADESQPAAVGIANTDSPAPPVPSTFRAAVPEQYQFDFDASLTGADEKRVDAEASSADRFDRAVGDWNPVRVARFPQLNGGVAYQPIPAVSGVDQPQPSGGRTQSPNLRRTIAICAAGLSLAAWLLIALRSLKSAPTAPPRLS